MTDDVCPCQGLRVYVKDGTIICISCNGGKGRLVGFKPECICSTKHPFFITDDHGSIRCKECKTILGQTYATATNDILSDVQKIIDDE